MIHLVDCHGKHGVPDGVEYIGRAGRGGKPARAPLSNPYDVDQHGIEAAMRLYRVYIVNALAGATPVIIDELARLQRLASAGDLALGCWCCDRPAFIEGSGPAPAVRCHGDIVATVLEHWGVRLATFARPLHAGDTTGPERWAAWVKRDCGAHPHAVLAMVFGSAEFRELAKVSPEIAAGMPRWMRR